MRWVGYQQRYLADRSPRKVVNKSRRIGFSEVMAFEAACRAVGVELLPDTPPRVVTPVSQNIVSASHGQAKELMEKVMVHVKALGHGFVGDLINSETVTQAKLSTGATIKAFSSNPRSIRGDGGDVSWDECAHTPNPEKVWAALGPLARPTLRCRDGYKIRIASTPLGDDNLFHDLCRDDRYKDKYSRHEVDWRAALADGFPFDEAEARAEYPDPDIFEQEFGCSFLSANLRYISAEVYDKAVYDDDMPKLPGSRVGGMDVARHRDNSAIVTFTKIMDTLWHERTEAKRDVSWDDQEQWVYDTVQPSGLQHLTRFCIDATGLGDQFAERLRTVFPGVIEPVVFTREVKEALATGLKLGLSSGRVRLRRDDSKLRSDVMNLRRIVTVANNVRIDAPRDKSGHADRAWAAALGVHAGGGAVSTTPTRGGTSREEPRHLPRTRRREWMGTTRGGRSPF